MRSRRSSRLFAVRAVVVWAVSLFWLACGDEDITAPEPGRIEVTTTTSGSPEDPDGYLLQVDENGPLPIGLNASATVSDLTAGDHLVRVSQLAENCSVVGENPRTVAVPEGGVAQVSFEIVCSATAGALTVTTSTSGSGVDPNGYLLQVDQAEPVRIGLDATTTVTDLPAGNHLVGLSQVSENCAVAGDNPRTVAVPAGGVVEVSFEIVCVTTTSGLTVTTSTSPADGDPDGYTVRLDAGPEQPIGTNASLALADLTPGAHTVTLGGIAATCQLDGPNPRTVELVAGQVAEVEFVMACASGVARWTAMASGTNADLPSVWGFSGSDVFAVGELPFNENFELASVILHWDGTEWSRQLRETNLVLRAIWGSSSSDVYAVGFDFFSPIAKLLRYDGVRWVEVPGFTSDFEELSFQSVWGTSATDVFAVGSAFDGEFALSLIYHFDGASWRRMPVPGDVSPALEDVWGSSPTDVYAVGRDDVSDPTNGVVLHFDGATWSPVVEEENVSLTSVWGSSATDVFAAGFRIEEVDDEFRVIGTVLHYDGTRWSPMELPEAGVLDDVWGTSATDVFVVGDEGVVLHYDGTAWTRTTPTNRALLGIWVASPSDAFAVGARGTILRGTP